MRMEGQMFQKENKNRNDRKKMHMYLVPVKNIEKITGSKEDEGRPSR